MCPAERESEEWAAKAAWRLAEECDDWEEEKKRVVRDFGGLDALSRLLVDRGADVEAGAATALWKLSRCPEANKATMIDLGLSTLVRVAEMGRSGLARCGAACCLTNVVNAESRDGRAALYEAGGMEALARLLRSSATHSAAATCVKLVAEHDEYKHALRTAGVVPALASLVSSRDSASVAVEEAAWALGNLAAKSTDGKTAIGAVGGLVASLVETVANRQRPWSCRRAACWALFNAAANNDDNAAGIVTHSGVVVLCRVLDDARQPDDQALVGSAAAALVPLAENDERVKRSVFDQGIVPRLVALLDDPDDSLKELGAVLLCVLTGSPDRDSHIVQGLPGLCRLLAAPNDNAKYAAAETIANLSAGYDLSTPILRNNAVPVLIDVINRCQDSNIKVAALHALVNLASDADLHRFGLPHHYVDPFDARPPLCVSTSPSLPALLLLQHWASGPLAPSELPDKVQYHQSSPFNSAALDWGDAVAGDNDDVSHTDATAFQPRANM